MHVLVPTFYFPPLNTPGTTRIVKVTEGLARRGIRLTVVTGALSEYASGSLAAKRGDDRILSTFPPTVRIVRTPAMRQEPWVRALEHPPFERLLSFCRVPDRLVRWQSHALRACEAVHRQSAVDCIWTSAHPLSSALLGEAASRRLSVPWVAEFQDPWTQSPFRVWESRLHYLWERRLQRRALGRAAHVIMNTPAARRQLLQDAPYLAPERVSAITNGFDPREIRAEDMAAGPPLRPGRIVLAHVGSMYTLAPEDEPRRRRSWRSRLRRGIEQWGRYTRAAYEPLHRSPWFLLLALRRLKERRPEVERQIRFVQVGSLGGTSEELQAVADGLGVGRMVEHVPRVGRDEAMDYVRRADVLVVNQLRPGDGSDCPCIAAKTFEYIATGKPILALVPRGDMRDLLDASGRAALAEPDDPEGIEAAMIELIDGARRHGVPPDPAFLHPYTWEAITEQVLDRLRAAAGTAA